MMVEAVSWVWLLQAMILVLFTGLVLAGIVVLITRKRPQRVYVLAPEKAQTWEQVREQIQDRSPAPVQWAYAEGAQERLQEQGVL